MQALVWCAIFLIGVADAGIRGPLERPGLGRVDSPSPGQAMIFAQSGSESARSSGAQPDADGREALKVQLYDLELVDQDGSKVKFKSDVVGDKIAVIIPFYTSCTTTYPVLVFMFTRLQKMLGEHLGKDVVLVSVTVDPKTDIPPRLKAYALRQKAGPGWVFLSGDRDSLGQVLLGVGALYSPNLEEHNHIPIALVGSARTAWRRFQGFPSPDQILAEINKLLAEKQQP